MQDPDSSKFEFKKRFFFFSLTQSFFIIRFFIKVSSKTYCTNWLLVHL